MVSFKGKSKENQAQVVADDRRALVNVGRDFKVYSDPEKIATADGVIAGTKTVETTRKSLPSKGENSSQQLGSKKCDGIPDKTKKRLDASVKVNVGRKALADVSNVRNIFSRNKGIDGSQPLKLLPANEGNSQQLDSSNLKKCAGSCKTKSKLESSVKVKVGRKILADVSNVRNILLRNRDNSGSQVLKIYNEKNLNGPKFPVGQYTTGASMSSRRSGMGTSRMDRSRGTEGPHTFRKFDTRYTKVCLDSQKIKGQGQCRDLFGTDNRKTTKRPSLLTRTSLPGVRSANVIDGNVESSGKGPGISVKVKVQRKVVPDVSTSRNHVLKNRASDGFISMKGKTGRQTLLQRIPAKQNIMDASTLPRKSLKPVGRTTFTVSRNQLTSKSKAMEGLKRSTFSSAKSPNIKEKSVKKSIPKNVGFVASHEDSPEKLSSDDNCGSSTNTRNNGRRAVCNRRQSFTSSLVAKSEVMKVCDKVTGQEELPSIDDLFNHLEVSEYVDEIYHYYWVMEAQYPSMEHYLTAQANITAKMRGILVNWLIEVHFKFELMQETLFLMVALFDRFLCVATVEKSEIQLVGLTALLLASKYEDFWHPKVKDLISIAAESYTRDQMLAMEKLMLKKLMFRLNMPTPYVFMLRFLKAAKSEKKLEHLAFYLIELCLIEYEALKFKPSLLCASAIYVASCTLEITPAWTPLLLKHTHYEESELRSCAEMILRFQKAASKGQLKVTYEKHMSADLSFVAAIKPLNKLPQ